MDTVIKKENLVKANKNTRAIDATTLSPVERFRQVCRAVAAGESNRSIAKRLHVDEGTICRDVKKLRLAPELRQKIEQGAAAEPLLRVAAKQRLLRMRAEHTERTKQLMITRLAEEATNHAHSYPLVEELLEILAQQDLSWAYLDQALWEAERRSWFVGNILDRPWLDALRAEQASCVTDRKEDLLWMEYLIQWLVGYACLRVPERRIRDAAFVGARKIVEANYYARDNGYLSRTSRKSHPPKYLVTPITPVTR